MIVVHCLHACVMCAYMRTHIHAWKKIVHMCIKKYILKIHACIRTIEYVYKGTNTKVF